MALRNILIASTKDVRFFLLLFGVFLASAKTHGRQLRLEREFAGYWRVVFGGDNPPFVEALWRQDRILYWSIAAIVAVVIVALNLKHTSDSLDWIRLLSLTILGSMTVAFVSSGLVSLIRLSGKIMAGASAPNESWLSSAMWGSALWWSLTFLSIVVTLYVGATKH